MDVCELHFHYFIITCRLIHEQSYLLLCNIFQILIRRGLLVKCKNTKQLRAILQLDNIGNIPVKVTEGARGAKGVIYAIPTEMTEEEILSELRTQQVTAVKRMTKRVKNGEDKDQMETNESKQIPLTSVILTFSTSTLHC